MVLVAQKNKIVRIVFKNAGGLALNGQGGQRIGGAGQLGFHLLHVIVVDVYVATRPYKFPHFHTKLLRHHVHQEGVACDIERHTQKHVRTALVQLAAQGVVGNIELKERVAWHQCHLIQFRYVPSTDNDASTVRIVLQVIHNALNLIDAFTALKGSIPLVHERWPRPPLGSIHRPQVALAIRPFVPDMIVAVKKVLNIGLALQKPQELRNNQAEWNKLGCYQGESFLEIKPHLMAKDAAGARSGSVGFFNPVFQSMLKKMQIRIHANREAYQPS